jgi:hypothetical protein
MENLDSYLKTGYEVRLDGSVLRVVFKRRETDEKKHIRMVELLAKDAREILEKSPEKVFLGLVDITALKNRAGLLSESSKKIYVDLIEEPNVLKTAIFGANAFYDAVLNFMAYTMQRGDKVKLFKTEDEALEWLSVLERDKS